MWIPRHRARRLVLLLLMAPLLGPAAVAARGAPAAPVRLEGGELPLPPQGAATAEAFATLVNDGAAAMTLVALKSPAAAEVSVHDMSMQGGVMRMRPAGPLVAPGRGRLVLGPTSGRHIMLSGVKRRLRAGDHVPLTLIFAGGAALETFLTVTGPAGP